MDNVLDDTRDDTIYNAKVPMANIRLTGKELISYGADGAGWTKYPVTKAPRRYETINRNGTLAAVKKFPRAMCNPQLV